MPFRGTSKQRLEVWRGERVSTSGGLKKSDLVRNKRGKIVSKRKSQQAASQNNLGSHLRPSGKKIPAKEMLHPKKSEKKASSPKKEPAAEAEPVPKTVTPKSDPKSTKKRAPKAKRTKGKSNKPTVNPLTQQPRDRNARAEVSLDNIVRGKRKRKKVKRFGY